MPDLGSGGAPPTGRHGLRVCLRSIRWETDEPESLQPELSVTAPAATGFGTEF